MPSGGLYLYLLAEECLYDRQNGVGNAFTHIGRLVMMEDGGLAHGVVVDGRERDLERLI